MTKVSAVRRMTLTLSIIFTTLLIAMNGYGFEVTGSGIQYRNYPDSNQMRLFFEVKNDGSVLAENIQWTITSTDFEVTYEGSKGNCSSYYISGNYDIENGGVQFSSVKQEDCYFRSSITNYPASNASYSLSISDKGSNGIPVVVDDILFDAERDAAGEIILPPAVDSESFTFAIVTDNGEKKLRMDWALPEGLGDSLFKINIGNASTWNGDIYITLPSTVDHLLIPLTVIKQFPDMKRGYFTIATQAANKIVRSYSKSVTVDFATLEPSQEPVVTSFPFTGTGYLSLHENSINSHTYQPSSIIGTISLISEGGSFGQTCWQIDWTVPGMETMSFKLMDYGGNCRSPHMDSKLIVFENWACWGGGCQEDPAKPSQVGSQSIDMFLNMSDFKGLISLKGNNTTADGADMNYSLVADITLNLAP